MAVTTQPGHNQQVLVGVEGHRDFSTGLFGCFTDCGSCECRPVLMALTAVVALLVLLLLLLVSPSPSSSFGFFCFSHINECPTRPATSPCFTHQRLSYKASQVAMLHASTNVLQDQPGRHASRINACTTRPARSPCFTHQRLTYETSQVAMLHASTPLSLIHI